MIINSKQTFKMKLSENVMILLIAQSLLNKTINKMLKIQYNKQQKKCKFHKISRNSYKKNKKKMNKTIKFNKLILIKKFSEIKTT